MPTPFALQRAPLAGSQRRDPRGAVRSFASIFGATLLCAVSTLGCASSDGLFKDSCLFSSKDKSNVERLSSSAEREIVNRAALASTERKSPWEPTESELAQARADGVDLKDYVWATQRPNGGVLFPKKLPGPGPVVVLEPSTIAAPIGTEIVLVASFVGEDSTYMRVGEKIEWSLNGVGTFLAANPDDRSCCLNLTGKSEKRVDDRYLTTETTDKLWRIHRGTETPLDDVTILRGQTWASVQSQEEGTSSVFVFSDEIDNWDRRKASAEIHWIDAAFRFPKSQALPIGSTTRLGTNVRRRTNLDPRPGWIVRYEVVSGDVVLGPNNARVVDALTDADGNAYVEIRQKNAVAGVGRVSATVLRPADADQKSIPVEKTTFALSWTRSAPVDATLNLPPSVAVGSEFKGTATITNNSDFVNSANFTLVLSPNVRFVRGEVPPEKIENGRVVWKLTDLAPGQSTTLGFDLVRETAEPMDAEGAVDVLSQRSASNAAPTQGSGTSVPAPSTLGTQPPPVSPTPTPPAPAPLPADGTPPPVSPTPTPPAPAPLPADGTPPPVSPTPTPDPASQQPALGALSFPVSPVANGFDGAVVEIADASAATRETVAFRFPPFEDAEKTPRFREVSAELDAETNASAPDAEKNADSSPFVPATPEAGTPFEARFALTVPNRDAAPNADANRTSTPDAEEAEKVVVKLVARPGLDLLLPDGTRRADVAYPAAPLAELADVVYKVRLVADAPGPKALVFYAFRENGDLLTTDVLPITVAQPSENAQSAQSADNADVSPSAQSAQNAPNAESFQNARSSRLSEESASLFPQKSPVAERRPDGSVGAATEKARVGVPFVYRTVVRNFEEFAIEPNELDVALRLPPELAFATADASSPTNAASATVDSNRRRAVFRLGKRLEPRSEFELNVDLVAEKPGVVELEFELLDAATGARLADGRRSLEIAASPDALSNDAKTPRREPR
ncbi:MAG: hypothetical protein IJ991_19055 [Thermoguttaceae bacterium]|nr:hypothetical protein [Thermoguttaceae bacterium]